MTEKIEQLFDELQCAIGSEDEKAGSIAALNIGLHLLTLFERSTIALEQIASVVGQDQGLGNYIRQLNPFQR